MILASKSDAELIKDIELGKSAFQEGVFEKYLEEARNRGFDVSNLENKNQYEKEKTQMTSFSWEIFLEDIEVAPTWRHNLLRTILVNSAFYIFVLPWIALDIFMLETTGLTNDRVLVHQIITMLNPVVLVAFVVAYLENRTQFSDLIDTYEILSNHKFGFDFISNRYILVTPGIQYLGLAKIGAVLKKRLPDSDIFRPKNFFLRLFLGVIDFLFSGVTASIYIWKFDNEVKRNLTMFST